MDVTDFRVAVASCREAWERDLALFRVEVLAPEDSKLPVASVRTRWHPWTHHAHSDQGLKTGADEYESINGKGAAYFDVYVRTFVVQLTWSSCHFACCRPSRWRQ